MIGAARPPAHAVCCGGERLVLDRGVGASEGPVASEYKICPECEEEYTLSAIECADCGAALVFPDQLAAEPPPDAFPETDELECVRVGPLPWTRALSEALTSAGIEHRVQPDERDPEQGGVDPRHFGGETVYGTWVKPEDASAASEIDDVLFGHLEPENADESQGDEACPACQEPLAPEAIECGSCGLVFA